MTQPAHVEAAVMRAWDASHAVHTPARLSTVSQFASLAAGVITTGLTLLGGHLRFATAVRRPRRGDDSNVILVGEPILDGEHVRLVRMRMPAAAALHPRCAVNCVLEWRCRR